MPSPTSKGKSSLATKGKLVVIGVIALMIVIYATTFVMQVQACDQALSAIHAAYEKKLQFLRDSFNTYKLEHDAMPTGGGRRRRKRDADLSAVVEELEADNEEVGEAGAAGAAGAGCWVLGAGCWVLGAGCWVHGLAERMVTP